MTTKKITGSLCLLFLSLTILSACSTSEDSTDTKENNLIGKWFYISEKSDGEEILSTECDFEQFYDFFTTGDFSIVYVDNGPCEFSRMNGKFSVSNNRLEITNLLGSDDLNYSFDIVSLSEGRLVLENDDSEGTYRLELEKE